MTGTTRSKNRYYQTGQNELSEQKTAIDSTNDAKKIEEEYWYIADPSSQKQNQILLVFERMQRYRLLIR